MKQSLKIGLLGLSCLALMAVPALGHAMMIAPAPISQRVALADIVVVGKVTGFGDKLVSAVPPYGGDKVDYQIAIVKVNDPILGAKGVKEIKVGFIPPPPPSPPPMPGKPFLLIKPFRGFQLALDQDVCLFLVKHPTEDFYIGQNYFDVINKANNDAFDKNMDEVKHAASLIADPAASLKAKIADDRFLTAAMLLSRYKTQKPGAKKAELIDAEESKQILLAISDAEWNPKPMPGVFGFQMSPQAAFFRLSLTEKDGWKQPQDANALNDAAKKWLKDNAEKYRIERFVAETKEEKKDEK